MAETRNARQFMGVNVRAALLAGVLAGIVFLLLEMILMPLIGVSIWAPIRMMAAILLGSEVLPPPATFSFSIFVAAMVVHFALSILFAFILGSLVRGRTVASGVSIGLLFGLALYIFNFYVFTAFFPWFAEARNWVQIVVHLAFGAVAGWVYIRGELMVPRQRIVEPQPV